MELILNQAVVPMEISGIRRFSNLARSVEGACTLTIGEPDLDTPTTVKEAAKLALDNNETHYGENVGSLYLRQAIADFERQKNGLSYCADEVIVTVGATEALYVSLATILNPGDEVIIPTPAFSLYESITQMCRGVTVHLPTQDNQFQIDPHDLAKAITEKTKAIVLTSPNNPTGCIYTQETLDAIHELVKDKPIFVICDEVYRQLTYVPGYTSFSDYADMRDRIIVVQSFSKPYAMTGWRVGYILADQPIRDKMQMIHQYSVVSVPTFVQKACVVALDWDTSESLALFHRRRDYVYGRLVSMGLDVQEPEGAFYMFVDVRKYGMDSLTFCTRMLKEGLVGCVPGVYFSCEGFFRLSYCYSDEDLKKGLDRIASFVATLSPQ